jgi:hypothetical protein
MERTALRQATSRSALLAAAKREARMTRGKHDFVWRQRVLAVGLPLGAAIGAVAWHRERRRPRRALSVASGAAMAAIAVSYIGALVEWELFERNYRRTSGREP